MYRILDPYVVPRIRHDDVPDVDDFKWSASKETRAVWCEDKGTGETLFVCSPPKTMREALLAGFMMGKAAGWKERDANGMALIEEIFDQDVAHYTLYGYWPDEHFETHVHDTTPPEAVDDLPEQTCTEELPRPGQRARVSE